MDKEQWLHRYRAQLSGAGLNSRQLRLLLSATSAAYVEYSGNGWATDPEGAAQLTVGSLQAEEAS